MEIETGEKVLTNLQQRKIKDRETLPWVEKYRPSSLNELISHEGIISTIRRFIDEGKKIPNLLFYGPAGTGKTSTIKALAKEMYKDSYSSMVLELNASDERGINVVRDTLKSFVSNQATNIFSVNSQSQEQSNKTKLVILDEADSMTQAAQMALRRIIEKYQKSSRFCIICNYVSKVIPALQSRCTRFKFKHIPKKDAMERIMFICQQENLQFTEKGIDAAFEICEGDMRRVVNLLQSMNLISKSPLSDDKNLIIDEDYVYKTTGSVSPYIINNVKNILLTMSMNDAFTKISDIQKQMGLSVQTIIKELNTSIIYDPISEESKMQIVQRLAEIEYRLSLSGDEKLQLLSLIGIFVECRENKK